jgi:N-acetylmuramoyl-L-alanine amidase
MILPSVKQAQAASGIVTAGVANIRSQPSTQSAIVGTVYKDTSITTVSKSGEWYQVQIGSLTGWMHQSVLSEQNASAAATIASAASTSTSIPTATSAQAPTVVLDGQPMSFDVPPTIVNDRILVPMAAIFRAMGATVEWNAVTQTVIATRDNTQIILPIGSTTPVVDNKIWNLDVPARIVNNRTLAPLRFVGEALGGTVSWDEANNTAIITSPTSSPSTDTSTDTDTNTNTNTNTPTVKAVNTGSSTVNLRNGPGTSYNLVGSAGPGKTLAVLSNQGDWYQVKNGGSTAWVAGWVVTLIYDGEQTPDPVTPTTPATPTTPTTPTEPASGSDSMTLYSQRSSDGVKIYMESAVKLQTTKASSSNQVCYTFEDQKITGTAYLQEYLGASQVTAQGSNDGSNAKVTINLPAGVQYKTTTENNGCREVLFIPNFISSVSHSTFGSSGEKIAVSSVTAMGYTMATGSNRLEVTFNNALPGCASSSYSYNSSLIKSMVFESQGQSGSVLTITTTEPVKFSVGLNSDATCLNILFVAQSELQNRAPIVVLDAGHGGTDPGASGASLKEKDVNLAVVLKAGQLLTAKGIRVVYTRTDDSTVGLIDRSDIANFYNASVFVSVHCNASTSPTPSGTETYCYYPDDNPQLYMQKDERYNLALGLQQALVANLGLNDRGVKQSNLSVLRETTMPSALAELGFISTPSEEALMQQQQFKDKAAQAIAAAIANYMKEYVN